MLGQAGQYRGLVAESGADVEHSVIGLDVEQLGHQRDDEGLRDGLAVADRQRLIQVGEHPQLVRHEFVARHTRDGAHDGLRQPARRHMPAHQLDVEQNLLEHFLARFCEELFGSHRLDLLAGGVQQPRSVLENIMQNGR